jgi:hypothetical protein
MKTCQDPGLSDSSLNKLARSRISCRCRDVRADPVGAVDPYLQRGKGGCVAIYDDESAAPRSTLQRSPLDCPLAPEGSGKVIARSRRPVSKKMRAAFFPLVKRLVLHRMTVWSRQLGGVER